MINDPTATDRQGAVAPGVGCPYAVTPFDTPGEWPRADLNR